LVGDWPCRGRPAMPERPRRGLAPWPAGIAQFAAIQAVAPSLGGELRPIDTRDAGEIERAVVAFACEPLDRGLGLAGARAPQSDRRLRPDTTCRWSIPTAATS